MRSSLAPINRRYFAPEKNFTLEQLLLPSGLISEYEVRSSRSVTGGFARTRR